MTQYDAIWEVIKEWDIERKPGEGYAHATGTDVVTIMEALKKAEQDMTTNPSLNKPSKPDYSNATDVINKAKELEGRWADIANALLQANKDGYDRGLEDMAKAAKEVYSEVKDE